MKGSGTRRLHGHPHVICLTGGPCAGKTAVTAVLERELGSSLHIVPESASILYGGGFPRSHNAAEMRCVQRAIYQTQSAAEEFARIRYAKHGTHVCDRGTLDGAAYWPGTRADFCKKLGSTLSAEFARYDLVVHLETAREGAGWEPTAIRTESASQARGLDAKIQRAWEGHPRRVFIGSRTSFIEKVEEVLALIRLEIQTPRPARGRRGSSR